MLPLFQKPSQRRNKHGQRTNHGIKKWLPQECFQEQDRIFLFSSAAIRYQPGNCISAIRLDRRWNGTVWNDLIARKIVVRRCWHLKNNTCYSCWLQPEFSPRIFCQSCSEIFSVRAGRVQYALQRLGPPCRRTENIVRQLELTWEAFSCVSFSLFSTLMSKKPSTIFMCTHIHVPERTVRPWQVVPKSKDFNKQILLG